MRTLSTASLIAAALTLSLGAHADTVKFSSAAGSTTYTYISGQGSLNGTKGASVAYQNGAYASPISGSQWVSTDSNGGNGNIGTTNYTSQFTLLANENYTGTVSFMADNEAGILINGVEVYALNASTGFGGPTSINLLSSYFKAGVNTITLEDYNAGGPAAADFAGSVTGVAATPEPSSLLLMGTGLLGAVGAARRRFGIA